MIERHPWLSHCITSAIAATILQVVYGFDVKMLDTGSSNEGDTFYGRCESKATDVDVETVIVDVPLERRRQALKNHIAVDGGELGHVRQRW